MSQYTLTSRVLDILRDYVDIPNDRIDGLADDLDKMFAAYAAGHDEARVLNSQAIVDISK